MPSLSNSPLIRSAPHSRLSLAISLIKATVSGEILGVRVAALDLYFQKSLKPWRCHREPRLWLDNEEGLFPAPNYSCQENEEHAIRLRACWPFHLPLNDDELVS